MNDENIIIQKYRIIFLMNLLCSVFLVSGCGLKEIKEQTEVVESAGYIKGKIKINSTQKGPVIVLHFFDENGVPVKKNMTIASRKGEYSFPVIPGPHYIGAFIDINHDNEYQPEEHGNYHGHPTKINVAPNQTITVEDIVIDGPVIKPESGVKVVDRTSAAHRNIGSVVTFDDPRFTRDYYNIGLWKPFDFLKQAEGGLFFLEDYQDDKIPVLFIHGVLDGPTLWEEIIENLNRQQYQPWLLYYPTGMRLDMISDFIVLAMGKLENKYSYKQFYVVAHSMGGLVARSFVKKYVERSPENIEKLRLAMTINSPMNGMASATAGLEHSPIVVPSWRDVAPGSAFLKDIHAWNWPKEIPYHLVVSYIEGESGDGVVPLQSQAQHKLQSEATERYIFNNDHVGTLSDKNFLTLFNKILTDRLEK